MWRYLIVFNAALVFSALLVHLFFQAKEAKFPYARQVIDGGGAIEKDGSNTETNGSVGAGPSPYSAKQDAAAAPSLNAVDEPNEVSPHVLTEGHGAVLYSLLFSSVFSKRWPEFLPLLNARLQQPLPSRKDDHGQQAAQREHVARMGLFASLAEVPVDSSNAGALKSFLTQYLLSSSPRTWLLERAALHALMRPELSLSEEERDRVFARVDVRSRSLAGRSTHALLHSVFETRSGSW